MSPREPNPLDQQLSHSESSCVSLTSLVEKVQQEEAQSLAHKTVRFGTISVREYARVVGDHPETKVGPPMAIGDEYIQNEDLTLEEFEQQKPEHKRGLRMSSITRKNILVNVWGFSEEQVRNAEKEVQRIKKQRSASANQPKAVAAVDSAISTTRRRLGHAFRKKFVKSISMAAAGSMAPFAIAV